MCRESIADLPCQEGFIVPITKQGTVILPLSRLDTFKKRRSVVAHYESLMIV